MWNFCEPDGEAVRRILGRADWYLLIGLKHFLFLELLSSKLLPFPEPFGPAVGPGLAQDTFIDLLFH